MIHSTSSESLLGMIFALFYSLNRANRQMDGRTICVKIVITTGRDCVQPRGSINELPGAAVDAATKYKKIEI